MSADGSVGDESKAVEQLQAPARGRFRGSSRFRGNRGRQSNRGGVRSTSGRRQYSNDSQNYRPGWADNKMPDSTGVEVKSEEQLLSLFKRHYTPRITARCPPSPLVVSAGGLLDVVRATYLAVPNKLRTISEAEFCLVMGWALYKRCALVQKAFSPTTFVHDLDEFLPNHLEVPTSVAIYLKQIGNVKTHTGLDLFPDLWIPSEVRENYDPSVANDEGYGIRLMSGRAGFGAEHYMHLYPQVEFFRFLTGGALRYAADLRGRIAAGVRVLGNTMTLRPSYQNPLPMPRGYQFEDGDLFHRTGIGRHVFFHSAILGRYMVFVEAVKKELGFESLPLQIAGSAAMLGVATPTDLTRHQHATSYNMSSLVPLTEQQQCLSAALRFRYYITDDGLSPTGANAAQCLATDLPVLQTPAHLVFTGVSSAVTMTRTIVEYSRGGHT